MISLVISKRIATPVVNRFCNSYFQTIRTVSFENADEINEAAKSDMPISMENPYAKEKRQCILCKLGIEPDYKNVRLLSQFQSPHTGKIYEKNITGLCEYKQQRVVIEITKAQVAGLMGFMTKEPEFIKDPKLFDPNHPFRPHKY